MHNTWFEDLLVRILQVILKNPFASDTSLEYMYRSYYAPELAVVVTALLLGLLLRLILHKWKRLRVLIPFMLCNLIGAAVLLCNQYELGLLNIIGRVIMEYAGKISW